MIWAMLPLVFSLSGQIPSAPQPDPDAESLARIRRALSQPNPLQTPTIEPTFRVEVKERPRDLVVEKPNPLENPVPPGGRRAFDQRQQLGNPWAGQPLFQINMLPFAGRVLKSVKDARRAQNQREAHEEVLRDLSEFCATKKTCEGER